MSNRMSVADFNRLAARRAGRKVSEPAAEKPRARKPTKSKPLAPAVVSGQINRGAIVGLALYLPIRTESELNCREHHRAIGARRKAQRYELRTELRALCGVFKIEFPCSITFTRVSPVALDAGDNLPAAFKALRDELASIIGVDDGDAGYRWNYAQRVAAGNAYGVLIEITSPLNTGRGASDGKATNPSVQG